MFSGLLLYAAMAFLFTSCGGQKTETNNTDSTTTDTTTSAAAPNTIITTPENLLVVVHKVSNYAKWKASYDEHDSLRLASGVHSYVIGRGLKDSNMVLVALKIDDTTKAQAFVKDPSLKKAMQKGGVTGAPSISFVTEVWQDTANISTDLRSRTSFTVKDWDAFQKAFEDGKQERLDNGITDRVLGYDMHDNKKISIVTAITDTAKAFAYYRSDALKARVKAGGATTEPQRFLFRIVQRY
jgi:uncharacterized protein YeaO (DUF488 family)